MERPVEGYRGLATCTNASGHRQLEKGELYYIEVGPGIFASRPFAYVYRPDKQTYVCAAWAIRFDTTGARV